MQACNFRTKKAGAQGSRGSGTSGTVWVTEGNSLRKNWHTFPSVATSLFTRSQGRNGMPAGPRRHRSDGCERLC